MTQFSRKGSGRKPDPSEQTKVEDAFLNVPFVKEICRVVEQHSLIGRQFHLTKDEDLSGVGVEMEWLAPDDQIEEAFEFYPGLAAINYGYIPIGRCLKGSGDPYFLKQVHEEMRIFRIPHDAVLDNDNLDESQIEYVNTLNVLLKH